MLSVSNSNGVNSNNVRDSLKTYPNSHVSNSNGVNSNVCFGSAWAFISVVSNSNGVNSNQPYALPKSPKHCFKLQRSKF